jgi:hypothetical protein
MILGDWMEMKKVGPQRYIRDMEETVAKLDGIISASPKPVEYVTKKRELSFKVDLTGWKYLPRIEQEDPEALKRAKQIYPSVKVTILMDDDSSDYAAAWYIVQRRLEIKVYPFMSVEDVASDLRNSISHEMQHFGQDFLARIVKTDKAGLPPRKIRTPEIEQSWRGRKERSTGQVRKYSPREQAIIDRLDKQGITKEMFHDLDDVEFYTELTAAIRDIQKSVEFVDKNIRDDVLHSMLGVGKPLPGAYPPYFIKLLKDHAPLKWRKAVIEIYKALF